MPTVRTRERIPPFEAPQLESISRILAGPDSGLTASQIGQLLAGNGIPDPSPATADWRRLYMAFSEFQNRHLMANHVVVFILNAMRAASPARPERLKSCRTELNRVLLHCGMTLGDDGAMRRMGKAKSLDEALSRSNRMQAALRQRNVHPEVLNCCRAETVQENCTFAILEAMQSVSEEIRQLAERGGDGVGLVEKVFAFRDSHRPVLAINPLETESERGEQQALIGVLRGLYGLSRNLTAAEPRIEWEMNEADALDVLSIISMVRRKLDKATRLVDHV